MLYFMFICAFIPGFVITDALVVFNSTALLQKLQALNATCVKNTTARAVMSPKTNQIAIQVSWSVESKCMPEVIGFQIVYVTNSGQSRYFSLTKKKRSCLIELPKSASRPENYTLFISCQPFQKYRSSVVIHGRDICAAFSKFNILAPFHCFGALDIIYVRKCNGRSVQVSWKKPKVTGFRDYLVRIATVSCTSGEECCRHANYKKILQLEKSAHNVTFTDIEDAKKYCIEILMCPTDSKVNLNCELKHSPIFISCTERKPSKLFLIGCFALVLVALTILGIVLWRYKKRNQRYERNNKLSIGLHKSEAESETGHLKETSVQDPLLFIVYCPGCTAVEEYVLHLTQFFRLNGIDARSELTQENAIFKHGRGVFLNKMFSKADFILILCTDVIDDFPQHNSYVYSISAIQNNIVERGENLSRYFMIHFNEIENIPDILRSASIDTSNGQEFAMEKIVRRIFGLQLYDIDDITIQKNEIQLSDKALAKVDELNGLWRRIETSKHARCSKKSCPKGKN